LALVVCLAFLNFLALFPDARGALTINEVFGNVGSQIDYETPHRQHGPLLSWKVLANSLSGGCSLVVSVDLCTLEGLGSSKLGLGGCL